MNIKNEPIKLNRQKCCELAETLFLKESGCGQEGEKYERMRKDAFSMREILDPRIDLKGIYSIYEDFSLNGEILNVEGVQFQCKAFGNVDPDSLDGVVFYAFTAGDYYFEDRPIMQQLYADIWGTAFTGAIREMFMDEIKKEFPISDSFGPGFYGMSVSEMKKITEMVDFARIGMTVKDSSIILPIKSCAGIVFRVNQKYAKLNSACRLCLGSKKTCSLCSVNGR